MHPLISVVDYNLVWHRPENNEIICIQDFYPIGLKRIVGGKLRYGYQECHFDEGIMSFTDPGRVYRQEIPEASGDRPGLSGRRLWGDPDFLWNTPLAQRIQSYEFVGYNVNEAIFVSKEEEQLIAGILQANERGRSSGLRDRSLFPRLPDRVAASINGKKYAAAIFR